MSRLRSATALRRLYERYRTATSVRTSTRRPGEWLDIAPDSEDGSTFEAAFGVASDHSDAEDAVKSFAASPLNGALGILHVLDIRVVARREAARSKKLAVRFVLVPTGKSLRGSKPTPRTELPPVSAQLSLAEKVDVQQKVDVQKNATSLTGDVSGTASEGGTTASAGGSLDHDEVAMVLPDGSPLPDLSDMRMPHELAELWRNGQLNDLDAKDALFDDYADLISEVLEEEALGSLLEGIRTNAALASGTPAIAVQPERSDSWMVVSRDVVSWIGSTMQSIRAANGRGQLLVLAPSPGTGKSRGMMEAAAAEQSARRTVGYAVLSRAQIPETAARLLKSGPDVRLIVIEGRHDGNCLYMDQVTVATNAGFSPGSTVCPSCPMYPQFGFNKRNVCAYYGARMEAARDRRDAKRSHGYSRIILTTHASAIQGSRITKKRYQSFWEFDTLFIDEDPTSSLVEEHDLTPGSLTYSRNDANGNPDGPTYGTGVLRDAMEEARKQRASAAAHGFVNSDGTPDRIHTRDHGSSYAGGDLHALLEPIARRYQWTLKGLAATVIDGMTGTPMKGEIMGLDAQQVAARFPNRHLASVFAALDIEITAVAEARAAGADLEPAYRVHLDLVPGEDGDVDPVLRVHELRGYANGRTNIVVGDAYANVQHYEGLFDRYQRDGSVHVLKHRAIWPTTSTLVRVVTKAGPKQLSNYTQLVDHLETNVRPVLMLERGRRIVFYAHSVMKDDVATWLSSVKDELELGEYEIEHWGGGRGKDTYRDFHTFIAVTEYVPNVGALIHEANTLAALASPGHTRVAHWNGYAPRQGSMGLANSLSMASPFYQAAFHRKTTDELAQAVHRIRPAMPSPDGQQKRAYVFGHSVPWTDELVAATTAAAVTDNGNDVDLEVEAIGRGLRLSVNETLSLISAREVAGAMAAVFQQLGCWSHAFAHALVGVPTWDTVEELVVRGSFQRSGLDGRWGTLLRDLSVSEPPPPSALVERVLKPPRAWASITRRLHDVSRIYDAGVRFFTEALPAFAEPRRHRASWMPSGSRGYAFWGDRERFERVLDLYAPGAEKIPF